MCNETLHAAQAQANFTNFKAFLLAHGAADREHSGHSLWSHFSGVHAILQRTGHTEPVCTAGLFHSVYGTKAFRPVTIEKTRRADVARLTGEYAEALVFAFCELPRPQLFEASLKSQQIPEQIAAYLPVHTHEGLPTTANRTQQFYAELLALECANLIEQRSLHQFPILAQYAQAIGMLDAEGFCI